MVTVTDGQLLGFACLAAITAISVLALWRPAWWERGNYRTWNGPGATDSEAAEQSLAKERTMASLLHRTGGTLTPADDTTPCPRCGKPLAWLADGETVKGQGPDRMHSRCYDGERGYR